MSDLWDTAPVGLLLVAADGAMLRANQALLRWTGREQLEPGLRLDELLSVGARIYWQTHVAPMLHVDGRVEEIALDLRGRVGRLPILLSAHVEGDVVHVSACLASERRRFEQELIAARRAAEQSAARLAELQRVTSALSSAVGTRAVVTAVLDGRGEVFLRGEDGLVGDGQPAPLSVEELEALRAPTTRAGSVLVPLRSGTRIHGVLSVPSPEGLAQEQLDLDVLDAIGLQAGIALDRAALYEQSASVAHELQRSLLDVALPQDARYRAGSAYRPGVESLDVGGDWWDVFLPRPGVLAAVVGDVVGRGLLAASAMGQLRSALRALAGAGAGPRALLTELDGFVRTSEAATMSTVGLAELDLATGLVTYACAGQPPPVLLPVSGPPRLLWEGRSTPLGAYRGPARSQATVQLAPGDRLLLWTDGLVERRSRSFDDGMAALLEAVEHVRDLAPDAAAHALTETLLRDEEGRDDVCVLVLSWEGEAYSSELSADLTDLSQLRRALGRWLAELGVPTGTGQDLVLATSEAVANASEHGCGGRPECLVQVHAARHGSEIVIEVRDAGRWRPSRPASVERGRGLSIMEALVDDVSLETSEAGTTVHLRHRLGLT